MIKATIRLCLCLFFAQSGLAKSLVNLNEEGVALEGYDPVSYFQSSSPVKGLKQIQFSTVHGVYYFANEKNKQIFAENPQKYEPAYGGWCAYAVAESQSKVKIDPKSFIIQDGRLLLFYDGFLTDTRKWWLKDQQNYLKKADQNWPEVEKQNY